MTVELQKLAEADKEIPGTPSWISMTRNYLSWISPLDIDGVTVEGLQVRVEAHEQLANEAVRAQLEYRAPKGKTEPLARVEWKPLAGHNNKGRGPKDLRFRPFRQTHVHRFALNWDDERQRLFSGNLPIAIPIQGVDSYSSFLDICAVELRVKNMSLIPVPPWQERML